MFGQLTQCMWPCGILHEQVSIQRFPSTSHSFCGSLDFSATPPGCGQLNQKHRPENGHSSISLVNIKDTSILLDESCPSWGSTESDGLLR